MADIGVFPEELKPYLRAPTTAYAILAEFEFGDGEGGTIIRRFHRGVGTITAGGKKWEGVTDPDKTRVVSIGAVELPTVKSASKVDITLAGLDKEFLSALRQEISVIYGAPAELYLQVYNHDTYETISEPVLWFDNGVCGMPTITANAKGERSIVIVIDGILAAKNFPPGGRMNDANQKARYPDDRGAELIGSTAYEIIR